MRIVAEKITGGQLRPGDLFSTAGPEYWDHLPHPDSVGERVYIRTMAPTPVGQEEDEIYRITIQREDSEASPRRPHGKRD